MAFVAQVLFKFDFVSFPVILYLIAVSLFAYSFRDQQNDKLSQCDLRLTRTIDSVVSTRWLEWSCVLILLIVAAFFRLYRLDSQPAGLWIDETQTGLNALEIIEGKPASIWGVTPLDRFRPYWVKTSNLYLYYVILILKIFGADRFGLKMVSVLPAIASVIAAYFLFKEFSNKPILRRTRMRIP